jgi:hypothetical protein
MRPTFPGRVGNATGSRLYRLSPDMFPTTVMPSHRGSEPGVVADPVPSGAPMIRARAETLASSHGVVGIDAVETSPALNRLSTSGLPDPDEGPLTLTADEGGFTRKVVEVSPAAVRLRKAVLNAKERERRNRRARIPSFTN